MDRKEDEYEKETDEAINQNVREEEKNLEGK